MSEPASGRAELPSPTRLPRIDRALHPPRFFTWKLLAIVAAVIGVLGLTGGIWYYTSTASNRAAGLIVAAGGKVRYAHDNPATGIVVAVELTGPAVRDELLAELSPWTFYLPGVTSLDLSGASITAKALAALDGAAICTLRLDRTAITDAALSKLERLPQLESLSLQHTPVSDAGVATLARLPHLQMLYLAGSNVTPEGVAALADCQQLRYVQLDAGQVRRAVLDELKNQRPDLSISVRPRVRQ